MKKIKVFLISMFGLFIMATITMSFSNISLSNMRSRVNTPAYYQGSFTEIVGSTFGYVKVYSVDPNGGQVVSAVYVSANNTTYGVHSVSGTCSSAYVQGFDGYVTINNVQYEIQYTGDLN